MTLNPGSRLGFYEILAPIGAGGMGEVYKARDTRLDRLVAIKVLPDALAHDPERLSRFEREARTLAALNHPNVAQIYGIEESSGVRALVMELVSGEPVKGPLPAETAVSYARQIADALEAAHEKGIVHRDLKPANILVATDGVVKVLDFGLALVAQTSAPADPANSPTLTMTQTGVIMGTAAYMSPEQARGKTVDRRSDIWAFGVVLAELIHGTPLFAGDTVADILVKVLGKEPDLSDLPPHIRYVAQRCLRHDPRQRWQAIGDARMALEEGPPEAPAMPQPASGPRRNLVPWVAAGALALVAAATSLMAWRAARSAGGAEARPLVRLDADLGPDLHQPVAYASTTVAISPDGTRLVYPIRDAQGRQMLASRLLDQPTGSRITGTEGGFAPFFSPEGQSIGFFADDKLKRIALNGGVPVPLAEASNPRGASWGEDGTIVAALTNTAGLSRIPAAGGAAPQPVTQLRGAEATHRWPQVLPGGQEVLFTSNDNLSNYEGATVEVVSLKTGARRAVQTGGYFGRFATSGHLLYIHNGQLFALPMSGSAGKARGTPVEILNDVASSLTSAAGRFDVSRTGIFVYDSGKAAPETWSIAAINASGARKKQPQLDAPGAYLNVHYSPDGQRLVLQIETKGLDVYTYNLKTDFLSRLTFTGKQALSGIWAPDGQHVIFESTDGAQNKMIWVRTDGTGRPVELLERKDLTSYSVSNDGRRVAYHERSGTNYDIYTLPLDLSDPDHPKPGTPEPFAQTPANEMYPVFSPDHRWLAYASDESGTYDVYVRPFPDTRTGGKWQVSFGGGTWPRWPQGGKRLFFAAPDNRIMAAEYSVNGNSFVPAKPRLWSNQQLISPTGEPTFDVSPDGTTIEALVPAAEDNKPGFHVTFLLNFFDELRRRVPGSR